jgi:hypothetical protein
MVVAQHELEVGEIGTAASAVRHREGNVHAAIVATPAWAQQLQRGGIVPVTI